MNEGWKEMKKERKESYRRGKGGKEEKNRKKQGERKQKEKEGWRGAQETCSFANRPPCLINVGMIHARLEHSEEIGWKTFSGQLGYFISSYFILFCCEGNKLKGEFSGV